MAPILGYWNIRGYAQPIRLMLVYGKVDFEDKRYSYGPAPKYDRSAWLKDKPNLGLDFPNLPYYIDGDTKLTQSMAIMRYLGRKLGLDPKSEEEQMIADMVEQQAVDLRTGLVRIVYNADFEKLKPDYLNSLPGILKQFSTFLGDRKWFVSDSNMTYVDFLIYEALDHHKELKSDCLDEFQNLKNFMQEFENIPIIKNYMESDGFLKWPLNGDMAEFGSRKCKK